jgi:hypothetical protein
MTPSSRPRFKKTFSRPLAELVNRALDPLVAKQGFGESSLLLQWEAIVGARVSDICQPIRMQWPPRAKPRTTDKQRTPDKPQEPATLALRVEPGFGLDIQHMSGAIIDRVNAHLGWRCVARLSIRQEPLRHDAPRARPAPPRDPIARMRAEAATEGVADEALRKALVALGERVLARTAGEAEGLQSE